MAIRAGEERACWIGAMDPVKYKREGEGVARWMNEFVAKTEEASVEGNTKCEC